MSVILFSSNELSDLASSLYREVTGDFIFTYHERTIAKQEALHQHETRSDLEILLDEYRWFFERVSLANYAEHIYNYGKYDHDYQVKRNTISVISQDHKLTLKEIYDKLKSVRYNSDSFLNKRDAEKLNRFIDLSSDYLIKDSTPEVLN